MSVLTQNIYYFYTLTSTLVVAVWGVLFEPWEKMVVGADGTPFDDVRIAA